MVRDYRATLEYQPNEVPVFLSLIQLLRDKRRFSRLIVVASAVFALLTATACSSEKPSGAVQGDLPSAKDNICDSTAAGPVGEREYKCVWYWASILAHHPDLPEKLDLLVNKLESTSSSSDSSSPTQSEQLEQPPSTPSSGSSPPPSSSGPSLEEGKKAPSVVTIKTSKGDVSAKADTINVLVTTLSLDSLREIQAFLTKVPGRAQALGIDISDHVTRSSPDKKVMLVLGDSPTIDIKGPNGRDKQTIKIYPDINLSVGRIVVCACGEENLPLAKDLLGRDYVEMGRAGRGPPFDIVIVSPIRKVNIEGASEASTQLVSFIKAQEKSEKSFPYAEAAIVAGVAAYAKSTPKTKPPGGGGPRGPSGRPTPRPTPPRSSGGGSFGKRGRRTGYVIRLDA